MRKILIIEDEYPVRAILKDLLTEKGFITFEASDGIEGVRLAKEIIPDLIISDIMMPEADGYSVKMELEKNDVTSHIPFIFVTAKADYQDIRLGMEYGADDYIPKPFKAKDLLKAIEVRLSKAESMKHYFQNHESKQLERKRYDSEDHLFIDFKNKTQFVKIRDIVCINADNEYSELITLNGNKFLIRRTLAKWENILPENVFVRIHRSTIININYIEKMEKFSSRTIKIWMKNVKSEVMVSQRYAVKLRAQLNI